MESGYLEAVSSFLNQTVFLSGGLIARPYCLCVRIFSVIHQFKSTCKELSFAGILLGLGIFWSVVGVIFTPTMKLYNQILIALVYLPSLYLLCRYPQHLVALFCSSKALWFLAVIVGWALLSLSWSHGVERLGVAIKRELLFTMLIVAGVFCVRKYPELVRPTLVLLGVIASLYSLLALCLGDAFGPGRINGFGGFLDNPNSAGYTIAFMMVLASATWPAKLSWRMVFIAMQLCSLAYVISTGSRGALLSLAAACFIFTMVGEQTARRLTALGSLVVVVIAVIALDPQLVARGDSYRLKLIMDGLEVAKQNLWFGLGMGTEYGVTAGAAVLQHCHNFIVDTLIQYGVVGVVLWAAMWLYIGWLAWCMRKGPLGAVPLLTWIFASVALQFDVFVLFGRSRAVWLEVWIPLILIAGLEANQTDAFKSSRAPVQKIT